MFLTKFPIVLAGMNPVSDVNLAVAAYRAGIMPTISSFIYYKNKKLDNFLFNTGLLEYIKKTNSSNVIITLDAKDLKNKDTVKILVNYNIKYVELVEGVDKDSWSSIKKICKNNNILPIIKILHIDEILDDFDIIILKGPDGAGRTRADVLNLYDMFNLIKKKYPNLNVIVSGGIGKGEEIEKYLNNGAIAVAIGTLFAATKESCVSNETKKKMIESNFSDVVKLGPLQQNAIIFSKIVDDDCNNSKSIRLGIKSQDQGHIFVGSSVDNINKILTLNDVLKNLLKGTTYEKIINNDNNVSDSN